MKSLNLKSYFEKGLTDEEYISFLGENRALHQLHYKKFEIPGEEAKEIKRMKPLKILVLTEPWCGDSLAIFPVIRKIAEFNGTWTIKVVLRDQNLELMDQFLTRGGRAVPIFLFLSNGEDDDYSLIFRWGPRPKAVQEIFETHRQHIKNGKIKKMEVIQKIRNFYARDRGKAILTELLSILKEKEFDLIDYE
jgi:thiol-disulfide isomerase/thioredoxin